MSYIAMRGSGDADALARAFESRMLASAVSCTLVKSVHRACGDAQVHILVFEKYFMRSSNRASLTVVLTRDGQSIIADLIGAGGGTGVFLDFSWGAEEDFAGTAAGILQSLGFL